jgi:hypothetical protein
MLMQVFPIFVGSGRSGTTLFRNLFDAHSMLAMTHEAHFIAPLAHKRDVYEGGAVFNNELLIADLYANSNFVRQGLDEQAVRRVLEAGAPQTYPDAVRAVYALYAESHGKGLYGDKTPGYVIQLDLLGELFPEARFVHIIRDGRDVALAYVDRPEWGPSTIADGAHYWKSRVGRGRASGERLGSGRYREVRYEDMVDDPEGTARALCAFLGLPFEGGMLDFHQKGKEFAASTPHPDAFQNLAKPITKGMRDWRRQMVPDDVALFEAIAGDLLASTGYEVSGSKLTAGLRAKVMWAEVAWQGKRIGAQASPRWKKLRARITGA